MSGDIAVLSAERAARLVPPHERPELLAVLREALALLPVAEAVVAACDRPGTKASEPARTAGTVCSAFHLMAVRVRRLAIDPPLRNRLAQLLEYHSELVGQASLMAYGERTERTERARAGGGLGAPGVELATLAGRLAGTLDPTLRTPAGTEDAR